MAELKFAAIDLGAESGRVIVGFFDGKKLRLEIAHRFPNLPASVAGTLCWDVLRLWNDIQDGLHKAATDFGADFSGVGVDTWGVDFGLLDAQDNLLGNPVHYRDKRTEGAMEAAFQIVPKAEIYGRTGLGFYPFNTLFQLFALQKSGSPQLEVAKTLLFMPDLLHFWLTGTKATEYSVASTSQLLDARTRFWDEDLLRQLDIPTSILQDILPPGSNLGAIRGDVAARTGMAPQTPVVAPASHDTASAVAAVPFSKAGGAYLSSGTWSLMGIESPEPLISEQAAAANFTNEGGVSGQIRVLRNIAGLYLVQECRRAFLRTGNESSYAELTEKAAQSEAATFIEPDEARFSTPASMPDEIRAFCAETGQNAPHSEGDIVRTCLNSLALKYRWTLENLEKIRGENIETLHIVGGGTQNRLLSQLTADCLGRPVICGPVEATATGNILVQAMARGELGNLDELRAVVRNSFEVETFEPRSDEKGAWDARFGRFEALAK